MPNSPRGLPGISEGRSSINTNPSLYREEKHTTLDPHILKKGDYFYNNYGDMQRSGAAKKVFGVKKKMTRDYENTLKFPRCKRGLTTDKIDDDDGVLAGQPPESPIKVEGDLKGSGAGAMGPVKSPYEKKKTLPDTLYNFYSKASHH